MKRFVNAGLVIAVVVPLLAGCGAMRHGMRDLGKMHQANTEAARELARDVLETWPFKSGFIRAALGNRLNEIPCQACAAMDALDVLAEKKDWTDRELGECLGHRVRMLEETVRQVLERIVPDVVGLLWGV